MMEKKLWKKLLLTSLFINGLLIGAYFVEWDKLSTGIANHQLQSSLITIQLSPKTKAPIVALDNDSIQLYKGCCSQLSVLCDQKEKRAALKYIPQRATIKKLNDSTLFLIPRTKGIAA